MSWIALGLATAAKPCSVVAIVGFELAKCYLLIEPRISNYGAGSKREDAKRCNQFQENLPGVAIRCGQDHPDEYGKVGG